MKVTCVAKFMFSSGGGTCGGGITELIICFVGGTLLILNSTFSSATMCISLLGWVVGNSHTLKEPSDIP